MYALRDFGSFHAGGRIVNVSDKEKRMIRFTADTAHEYDPNGDFLIEQVYVQYFIPAEQTFPHPLVSSSTAVVGFPGSSHMFMMDEHSAEISGWLGAWIRRSC